MRKLALISLVCLLVTSVFAEELNFTQKDIDKFLSFADEFTTMARKYIQDSGELSLIDLFYHESEELMEAAEEFLKRHDWDYLKMNDFMYVTGVVMEYLSLVDAWGGDMAAMLGEMVEEIPPDVIDLVKKNKDALLEFFPGIDYDEYMQDLGLPGDLDDLMDMGDIPGTGEGDWPEPVDDPGAEGYETAEEVYFVTGTWVLGSNNMYVWNFEVDGSLSVGEVSPVAAEVGGWQGSYVVEGDTVFVMLDKPNPFPDSFTLQEEGRLEGEGDFLIRR